MSDDDLQSRPVYDRVAERFAERAADGAINALHERVATLALLPDLAGRRVLDAGCGPGLLAAELIARGAEVTGVDASAEMLRLARARVPAADLRLADLGEPLDFVDARFDVVVSSLVLDHVRDWRPLMREIARVLVPGGTLVFSTSHPVGDFELSPSQVYLATERVERPWPHFGEVMPFWRRPFGEILAPVIEAGLAIDRVVEPAPTDELRARFPEQAARIDRRPLFVWVRAVRACEGITRSDSIARAR